jgi:hypothetical protein
VISRAWDIGEEPATPGRLRLDALEFEDDGSGVASKDGVKGSLKLFELALLCDDCKERVYISNDQHHLMMGTYMMPATWPKSLLGWRTDQCLRWIDVHIIIHSLT